jgi:tetratricopeptide (TPR) repeat protein
MGEARATVVPAASSSDFLICHTPVAAGRTNTVLRLAQTRTEVPPTEMKAAMPAPAFADSDPPLWDGLGSVTYKISTLSAEAQAYFDQGLRLAYAFNHGEAQRAFRKAQKLDPSCAMCFWGEALVLGPNINFPMQEDAVGPAFAAVQRALALSPNASPREQALIAALETRYSQDPKADRAPLDAAYAAAMGKLAADFPDENEIALLYAEAVMDLSPWNYWQPGGHEPNPQSAPIVPTLERVLAKDPNHPGAIHIYIHAVEASDRPQRAEPHADRLRGAIPGAGHLVHMPSHIYYRVGRYLDALAVNKIATTVDEKYLADTSAPMGVYRLGYYPHSVHFVLASAQMAGDGATVIAAAEKLRGLIPDEVARDRRDRRLSVVELGKAYLGVGVDEGLLVDASHALQIADIERILGAAVTWMLTLELAVRLLLGLGLFQRDDLRLGQHQALLGALGFQRLEPLVHSLQVVA